MPIKIGPICKFKCQHCNSYYTKCMSYEEYQNRTGFITLIEIINPDCTCCKLMYGTMSCDKCKCHAGTAGGNFKFVKEYNGKIWSPDFYEYMDDVKTYF